MFIQHDRLSVTIPTLKAKLWRYILVRAAPLDIKMYRFEHIDLDVEWVEDYRKGGYHPVHLHDIFNQRYKVTAKLAYGSFSTVWLAQDQL